MNPRHDTGTATLPPLKGGGSAAVVAGAANGSSWQCHGSALSRDFPDVTKNTAEDTSTTASRLLPRRVTNPAALSDLVEAALDNAAIRLTPQQRRDLKTALADCIDAHHLALVDRHQLPPGDPTLPAASKALPRPSAESVRNESHGETPEAS